MSTEWMAEGACVPLPLRIVDEIFFPEDISDPNVWDTARSLCAECPVRAKCLAETLLHAPTDGMWGGLIPDERQAIGISTGATRQKPGSGRKHGTYSKWESGCRCESCVKAKREYNNRQMREWRRWKGQQDNDHIVLPTYRRDK